jgi:pyridoxamine 5'-phosphate oxidase
MKDSDLQIVSTDPFEQFTLWYKPVTESGEENHNAVALSTATTSGFVSSRIVLLKDFNSKGFIFFTNYNSRKGVQIKSNPYAAMLFYWPRFKKQVRIEGEISKVTDEESNKYFNSRPLGHKLNALASRQSSRIEHRKLLFRSLEELKTEYQDHDPVRPEYWGGYRLVPKMFEFWQEGLERFHDRVVYEFTDTRWEIYRLSP